MDSIVKSTEFKFTGYIYLPSSSDNKISKGDIDDNMSTDSTNTILNLYIELCLECGIVMVK